MKIQIIERTRPIIEKEAPQKDEEPPKPGSKKTIIQKLIDGWIIAMKQGVAT